MCFKEEGVEVSKVINISSVTSIALYKDKEVNRGDFAARVRICSRIGADKSSLPAIFKETTDSSRRTRVSEIPFSHVFPRISVNSISLHNESSEATVYPIISHPSPEIENTILTDKTSNRQLRLRKILEYRKDKFRREVPRPRHHGLHHSKRP
jgi:hypothetical protein